MNKKLNFQVKYLELMLECGSKVSDSIMETVNNQCIRDSYVISENERFQI